MTAFAAAMDRIFGHPDMGISAVWIAGGTSEERPIRLIRRAPDRITEFGSARILSDTLTADIRISEIPDPRPGDLIVIGADSHVIQGEPIRDRDRLIWTVELVPA
ncbi:head-tail joining protein [Paracoccus tegillarcae]|uniref:Uncharacterized protein n=1 Tax=Paracoccus tegillarcae TaxID=1529068 RepID=A0A2K9ENA0_9RHOB|nr:hypothetical protein [Paracoccus tegillarcae]AUH32369.1 hypothetical protein CUV01_02255 [Paracoccus tegillarcae]AUH33125.1 hypothetical protein CUV01_06735 [Paracoccus tegillarcae]